MRASVRALLQRAAPTAPVVGVAAAIFARLPCGSVDVSKMVLIRRGTPPGQGLLVFAGGRQELGETLAGAAAREAREECGVDVHVADALCPGYAATDVLHPAAPPHGWHYAIVHVLTCVDARADASGRRAVLPVLRAGDDAADALWVDLSALLLQGGGGEPAGARPSAPPPPLPLPGGLEGGWLGGAGDAATPPRTRPPCLLELEAQGALVPLTVHVARRALRQWALLGVPTVGGSG